MKVLIVTQYFWPENMRINDLAIGLMERGHQVTVLTGVPNYPEGEVFKEFQNNPESFSKFHGVDVLRVPMLARGQSKIRLALNYLVFFLSASVLGPLKLRGQSIDVIFVYGVSPISVAIPAIVLKWLKKAKVYLWVLDLWPESISAVGAVNKPWVLSTVGEGVRWIYKNVDFILIQSMAFKESILKYAGRSSEKKIVYFPSWAEAVFSEPLPAKSITDERILLFAGNVGEAQDFPAVLLAMRHCQDLGLPIKLKIVGDGRAMPTVKSLVADWSLKNVDLCGRHPVEAMPKFYSEADALFLSLRSDDIFSRTIPGKLQSYFASGKPVIAMIDGEAKRVIEESGAGFAVGAGQSDSLVGILRKFVSLPSSELFVMTQKSRHYYEAHFDRAKIFSLLERLFQKSSV